MYSFLKARSLKICYMLDLWSQGNELTGKGNETKQLRKKLEHVSLSKALPGMQTTSER